MEEIREINKTAETVETSENEYRGSFTVSKGETIRFNLLMIRKNIAVSVTLLFTVVTGIRLYQYMRDGAAFLPALIQALPLAILCAVLIPTLQLSSTSLSILSLYRQGKAKPFAQDILLNDEGLFASSTSGTSKVVWKNLGFVRETPFDFLFFYSEKNAFVLPKKQMRDKDAECQKVREILRRRLPADRLKLRD